MPINSLPNSPHTRDLIREGTVRIGGDLFARRTCEYLLSGLLGVGRTALYLEEKEVDERFSRHFFSLLERVQKKEPLQYILEKAFFWEEEYRVTPATLIPRPSTELLVKACLDYFGGETQPEKDERNLLFIDIGTGCGCIAISLTRKVLCSKMLAIDRSQEALQVARGNALRYGVSERISWLCGDLFSPLRRGSFEADAILSNPPYVPTEEIESLPLEVLHEPRLALDGGKEGLFYYQRIAAEGSFFLKEGGFLFVEIGDGQSEPIESIFSETSFRLIGTRKDLEAIPRVMIFQKTGRG